MKADETALGSLERALSAEPLRSDVMEITVNGHPAKLQFVELSQTRYDQLRGEAIRWTEELRRENEDNGEWREAQVDLDAIRANRTDILALWAAMVDPDTDGPACSLEWLEKRMPPDVQEFLATAFAAWKQGISPDGVTQEIVEALIEDVKKKRQEPGLPAWLWTQYGYQRLLASVLYLVDLLSIYQSDASSGTSSGEDTPTEPP